MNFLISFVLITFKIVLGLGLDVNSNRFKFYQYNGNQNFKFTSNFESMHLLKSYETNHQSFSIIKCLSLSLKTSSIKAITYEVTNDSTIGCKLFSPPIIEFTDFIFYF